MSFKIQGVDAAPPPYKSEINVLEINVYLELLSTRRIAPVNTNGHLWCPELSYITLVKPSRTGTSQSLSDRHHSLNYYILIRFSVFGSLRVIFFDFDSNTTEIIRII